jgi:glycine/sarcosine N-methyltransferase
MNKIKKFYNNLSDNYHLIFDNWDMEIKNQAKLLEQFMPKINSNHFILDCSCGIGTQAIGLKELGYNIEASDISEEEVERCKVLSKLNKLNMVVRVDDMKTLTKALSNHYDLIFSLGNTLPHFTSDEIIIDAFKNIKSKLKHKGVFLIGIKDYEYHMSAKTRITQPLYIKDQYGERIIHQVWQWHDERFHDVHLYITVKKRNSWDVLHSVVNYRAITPQEVLNLMKRVGFSETTIIYPKDSGFYQPIIYGKNMAT